MDFLKKANVVAGTAGETVPTTFMASQFVPSAAVVSCNMQVPPEKPSTVLPLCDIWESYLTIGKVHAGDNGAVGSYYLGIQAAVLLGPGRRP